MDQVSNTNDGSFAGFQPVLQLAVELAPERSPPNALIAVNLQVPIGLSLQRSLLERFAGTDLLQVFLAK